MDTVLRITVFVIGIIFTVFVYYLLIRRKVSERMTLMWSLLAISGIIIASFPTLFNRLALLVGVSYPPALLFLITILFLMLLIMYQSIQISLLEQRTREIGRTLAILRTEIQSGSLALSGLNTNVVGNERSPYKSVNRNFVE